ncbi:MAG TPA: hypothetical protein VK524_27430 [Polyangiaceae bacterium]|nr:hypothetical protein [Polyangiaceae bacterium]
MKWKLERELALIACGLLSAACDDPLAEAQIIEATRVLGARVSVEDDAERAWPRPGERAEVSWLVASPRPPRPFGWAFSVCVAAPTTQGIPECAAAPFAEFHSEELGTAAPSFAFVTPDEAALGSAERLLVRGVVCTDEQPVLAEPIEHTRCAEELRLAVMPVGIERDSGNRNPSLVDEPLAFAGSEWPAPAAEWLDRDDCSASDAGPSLPLVSANGPKQRIALQLSENDREPARSLGKDSFEELWLSHFADRGRLARALSIFAPDTSDLSVELDWQPPRRVEGGKVVRFYFVARDLRGGADWTLRTACAVP